MSLSKQKLRDQLRNLRKSVPLAEQNSASNKLLELANKLNLFKKSIKIAIYWPNDGEINPLPLLKSSLTQNKLCYLPVLHIKSRQTLVFASYTLESPLIRNRYHIPEPDLDHATLLELTCFDIIFVPLVGFDDKGQRLGRGGGFYDAAFAELHKSPPLKWPKIIGLAYACQQVTDIPVDDSDWQLDAVITETEIFNFNLPSE